MQNLRRKNESGRSMVEMLGVLAIVGVLSVGGVYGYGVAMKKHKANELLHQASMLATTISAQIQSKGELPQNIENFGDAKYGTFNPPSEANAEQFTMQITDMDSAVCEQMEKMAGGMVRQAECSETTLTLTYNNNLSSDKVAADYNGKQDECEDSGRKYCDNDTCIPATEECPVTGPTCPTGSGTDSTTYTGASFVVMENEKTTTCYCPAGQSYDGENCKDDCTLNGKGYGEYEGKCVLCNQDDLWFYSGAPHEGVCIKCSTLGPGYAPNSNGGNATECRYCPDLGDDIGAVEDGYTCINCYEEDLAVDDNGNCIDCSTLGTRWAVANKEESSWSEWNTNGGCVECQIKSGYGLYGNGRNTECIFCPYISEGYGQYNGDCIKCSDLGDGYYPDNCDGIGCHDCVHCSDYKDQGYGLLEVYGVDKCVPCSSYDTVLNTNTLRCE